MGSIEGVPGVSATDKVWLVFQGLGDIAFAYPYSIILLEIQVLFLSGSLKVAFILNKQIILILFVMKDTLKSPPSETITMKKASRSAIIITTLFYLCCGSFGYAAFGNNTPGNLLTGFGFYEPYWLVDLANACVVLHLVGGYQVLHIILSHFMNLI